MARPGFPRTIMEFQDRFALGTVRANRPALCRQKRALRPLPLGSVSVVRRLVAYLTQPEQRAVDLYRLSHRLHESGHESFAMLIATLNRVLFSIDIEVGAEIGKDLTIYHGAGIVIGRGARIGDRCTLLQHITIGVIGAYEHAYPEIGDDVTIYAGAVLLGPIKIGDGAMIGANAVVLSDVPAGHVAVGVPARSHSR
jgi:serine O-acetyltransferase